METILAFIISITASTIGAITGVGGGILMKPLIDSMGMMSVSTVSFLSGCTVLTMCTVSLLRGRSSPVNLDMKIATPLALGAVVGGLSGNALFELAKQALGNDNQVGIIQSVLLWLVTASVLWYCNKKDGLKSYQYTSVLLCVGVGFSLGVISAFLGIGGGPMNLAVLFLFFSMGAKVAARTSLYIIFCSQLASLLLWLINRTVPEFDPLTLICMMLGGVLGALIGGKVSGKLTEKQTEYSFEGLLVVILIVVIYNIVQFATA